MFKILKSKWVEKNCLISLIAFRKTIILYHPKLYHILHFAPKLFDCIIYTLNSCYILHPKVNFTVMLYGNFEHITCTCIFFKWHKVKKKKKNFLKKNNISFQSIKKKYFFIFYPALFPLSCACVAASLPKSKSSTVPLLPLQRMADLNING